VLPYFEASIEEIDEVMNDHNIVDIEYEFVDRRWNSVPGQSVPESLYDCLCSELSEFEPGDHAVYEVCDNISESFDAKNRMYIYVKIVKKISDDSESFPFYLINTGDEGDIDARSHRLYKVVRTSCVSTTEVDTYAEQQIDSSLARSALYQTVEETLVEAWRLGQEEFKIVMRRLILRWHPDKNKNSSFCGDVFMHITAFAKRLQSGEIDVSKINKYRDRGSHQWQEEMKRATDATCGENEEYVFDVGDFADKVRKRNDRQHGNEQDERNYTLPDPQPGRGEVWIRQAKDDMAAAKISLITATDRTYNWVCVQSHQVNITYIVFIYFIFFVIFLEKGIFVFCNMQLICTVCYYINSRVQHRWCND
jgi:sacsin